MTESHAEAFNLTVTPRFPSRALLDLRRLVDAALMSSASVMSNGGGSGTAKDAAGRVVRGDRPAIRDTTGDRTGSVRAAGPADADDDSSDRSGGAR